MITKIRKSLSAKGIRIGSYELFILIVLFITITGYIFYLKTATQSKLVYVLANIQRPDWWQSDSHVPRELLASIKVGDKDNKNNIKVIEIKHFLSEQKDWEDYTTDRSVGRIQFEVQATKTNDKLLYQDQELLIGNPIDVTVGNTHFELLITGISDNKISQEYFNKKILVKIYSKYLEQIKHIKKGMELKDNDGIVYAKITDIRLENSPLTTVDQYGATHLAKDPLKYDLYIEIEIKVRDASGRIIGYDGRTIGVGKVFIFSSPTLDNIGGWITDIL